MEKSGLAIIVGAITTIITAIGTAKIKDASEQRNRMENQATIERLQNSLREGRDTLAACQVSQKECEVQGSQHAQKIKDLEGEGGEMDSEVTELTNRLSAACAVGNAYEFNRSAEFSLRRSDWVAIPLPGRTVAVELDRVTEEGPIFRIGGCQDPPVSEGLQLDDPRAPRFKLTKSQSEQRLRLSGSCCANGFLHCDRESLRSFSFTLEAFNDDVHTAKILVRTAPD